jgi:hypothetical protein
MRWQIHLKWCADAYNLANSDKNYKKKTLESRDAEKSAAAPRNVITSAKKLVTTLETLGFLAARLVDHIVAGG